MLALGRFKFRTLVSSPFYDMYRPLAVPLRVSVSLCLSFCLSLSMYVVYACCVCVRCVGLCWVPTNSNSLSLSLSCRLVPYCTSAMSACEQKPLLCPIKTHVVSRSSVRRGTVCVCVFVCMSAVFVCPQCEFVRLKVIGKIKWGKTITDASAKCLFSPSRIASFLFSPSI
jgi:hypothetical protein